VLVVMVRDLWLEIEGLCRELQLYEFHNISLYYRAS
jgi:hypothetical protein